MLREIAARLAADTALLAVAVGHTDEFGTEGDNLQLSSDRARACVALLTRDTAFLAQQFALDDPATTWSELEAHEIIEAVTAQGDFPPPLVPPQDAVTRYQTERGLSPSGLLDAATIQALTAEYADLVGGEPLAQARFSMLGGGSVHAPAPLGLEDEPVSPIADSPLFVNPRRVEFFLFRDRVTPPAETFQAPPVSTDPVYRAWRQRCRSTLLSPTGPLTLRLADGAGAALVGATIGVFHLDGSPAPEEGTAIAEGTTDGSGIGSFALRPAVYCLGLDTAAGPRRVFCRVASRSRNLVDVAFEASPRTST